MPDTPAPSSVDANGPSRLVLCPYCGELSRDSARCESCRGNFDPLSRQATQNSMGPWFTRDAAHPHRPGCSFDVIRTLVGRGKIEPNTVIRGPTTNQFWTPARRVPGVANLLGVCHNCGGPAGADDVACANCGATFRYHDDRQHLGLTEVRLLPGQALPELIDGKAGAHPASQADSRPIAPRASAPLARSAVPASQPVAAQEGESLQSGGVPRWVFVLAGVAILGAGTVAAWIMGKLPGFPSPILGSAPATERPALSNGPQSPAPPRSESTNGSPSAGSDGSGVDGSTGESKPGEGLPSSDGSPPTVSGQPEPRTGEARQKLESGTEPDLQDAIRLMEGDSGSAAAEVRGVAERLLRQLPLRRLP